MATDIQINGAGDLVIDNGDLQLVTEGTEVSQHLQIRFKTLQAEWLYDITIGLPWIDDLVDIQTSYDAKKQILRAEILSVSEIRRINKLEFAMDNASHIAEVEYDAETTYANVQSRITT